MASGLATVWLPLDEMNRAVRFYGETMGLDVKTEGDDWTEFDANGLTIGLNARKGTHKAAANHGNGGPGSRVLARHRTYGPGCALAPDPGLRDHIDR